MSIEMPRREFLAMTMTAVPVATLAAPASDGGGGALAKAIYVPVGQDRSGVRKGLGISTIDVKVATADTAGAILVIENTNRARGGPARHLHTAQDELFCVLEGEYVIEVGTDRFSLKAGDTILAPRQVPHVWAYVGASVGRLLITFSPAGQMEAFFREVAKNNAMPPQDPALWRAHGMELLGPPLAV